MEETLKVACGTVFMGAWIIGIPATIYTIIEFIAVLMFASFAFASGMVVVRMEQPLVVRPAALPVQGATAHATFRLNSPERCLFRESGSGLLVFRFFGPFFLKGTMDLRLGQAITVGRLALGPSVLFLALFAGWTAGSLGFILQEGWSVLGRVMLFLLLGWGLLGALAAFSILFARQGFFRAHEEVIAALRTKGSSLLLTHFRFSNRMNLCLGLFGLNFLMPGIMS
jgi:hypothetical protein